MVLASFREKFYLKKRDKRVFLFLLCIIIGSIELCSGQYTVKNYANHPSTERRVAFTDHFEIVYPSNLSQFVKKIQPFVEKIYDTYAQLLDEEPAEKIKLYINREKQFLSAQRALNAASYAPVWQNNPFFNCFNTARATWKPKLRYEIAYVFQQSILSSKLGLLQAFLLSSPESELWSAGLPAYLAVPFLTKCDISWLSNYWNVEKRVQKEEKKINQLGKTILGRSQIHFFSSLFPPQLLESLYNTHKSFLGIQYFDFNYAFLKTFGVPYGFFFKQWKRRQLQIYNDSLPAPAALAQKIDSLAAANQKGANRFKSVSLKSEPYSSFFNIEVDFPIVLPYYLNTEDFGLGGLLSWRSPLRLHKFMFAGVLSVPSITYKSFFYTSYVNNSLGPRIKLSFKHYTSASGWLDLNVRRSNIASLSSLWRIDSFSTRYSNWYAGFMLRYLHIDYFSPLPFINSVSNINFDNKFTAQTDLRLGIAWRELAPSSHNAIHPLKGHGFRFSVTASGPFLNSQTQYARFYTEAFTLIPTVGKHRVYLYSAGALDINDSIGADYLYFSAEGDYELPEPKLLGSIGSAVEGYIRGYDTPIVGEKFAMGTVEYRIPLTLDTETLLFGVLPYPKLALAFFAEGGVIGDARSTRRTGFTEYRFSAGAELKTALSLKGYSIAFKAGIAQPLDQPFGLNFYFTIQPAIPF